MKSMYRSSWNGSGGGGHLNIAGAQLDGVTMEEAIQKVKDVLTKMTEEGAI